MKLKMMNKVLVLLLFLLPMKVSAQSSDFTGRWRLNEQASDFQGQPVTLMFRQLMVKQTKDSLMIEGIRFDPNAKNTLTTYPLNGQIITATLPGDKTMKAFLKWSDNKQILTRTAVYYLASEPDKEAYTSVEDWVLSPDGRQLIVNRAFLIENQPIKVKVIYDKQ